MYFLGIDAGGTKTAFVLADDRGCIRARHTAGPCTFISYGAEKLTAILREGSAAVCAAAGIPVSDLTFAALGIPGHGEKENAAEEIQAACHAAGLPNITCESDCYIAWAGSLAMQPGVNIIAGTGAICYGVNAQGDTARASGWGKYCDEGSCRWLGEKLIALYAKQADGRMPRTPLYEIFRRHFNIQDDLLFIATLNHALDPTATAQLQILLAEAYSQGDPHAKALYNEAAEELALAAATAAKKLTLPPGCAVSYSGGLFRAGERILVPLTREIAARGGQCVAPKFAPELGAVLMAMRAVSPGRDFSGLCFT